jgi:uncharacterized protein YndB with AHSA1/START domain
MSNTREKTIITVQTEIHAAIEKVWMLWTRQEHICKWNQASDDWHTIRAENDLLKGGKFLSRMEAKDGSVGFDFEGEYVSVELHKQINFTMSDGRNVWISFESHGNTTIITEAFEAEEINSAELQKNGWQAILNNFKAYSESVKGKELLHFEIIINAHAAKVYYLMIEDKTYSEWTFEFNPTSHFKGSWEKNSKILFLGVDENGKMGGMVSVIKENIPEKFLSIKHLGILKDGIELTSGPEVDSWAGGLENYSFEEINGITTLGVDLDSIEDFREYFNETWPKALKKLKEICERH